MTDDVADYAVTLVLVGVRRVIEADLFVREGRWAKENLPFCPGLKDKVLGIFGMGRIGRAIAMRAEAFGLVPIYCDLRADDALPYRYVSDVKKLASEADILVISCAGNDQTRKAVDRTVIDAIGPDGILVNVARGMIVDEDALALALREGRLGYACLDTFENEPNVPESLVGLRNVVLTPHIASGTFTARAELARLAFENIATHFEGKAPPHLVD